MVLLVYNESSQVLCISILRIENGVMRGAIKVV